MYFYLKNKTEVCDLYIIFFSCTNLHIFFLFWLNNPLSLQECVSIQHDTKLNEIPMERSLVLGIQESSVNVGKAGCARFRVLSVIAECIKLSLYTKLE